MQVKRQRSTGIDKDQFTTRDYLINYCESRFGTPKKRGNEYVFPCPFGNHKNPYHLAVSASKGIGVWRCRSCDMGGDIFKLHAQLNGIPSTNGKNFFTILKDLAGMAFDDIKHQGNFYKAPKVSEETKQDGLTKEQLNELEACRVRLSNDFPLCCKLGAELSLSGTIIYSCATFTDSFPTLGVTPDNRLLFIYRAYDQEQDKYIPFMAKTRRFADGSTSPFLSLKENGVWESTGDMMKVNHARFIQVTKGSIKAPWGAQSLMTGKKCFVLCEGESDCLAVNDAMMTYQDAWQDEEGFEFDCLPVALGVPGASNLKAVSPDLFKGKAVVLCFDQDKAGSDAVIKLADKLRTSKALVFIWNPEGEMKDCREILIKQGGMKLATMVFNALKEAR